jgi:hypothetical protein
MEAPDWSLASLLTPWTEVRTGVIEWLASASTDPRCASERWLPLLDAFTAWEEPVLYAFQQDNASKGVAALTDAFAGSGWAALWQAREDALASVSGAEYTVMRVSVDFLFERLRAFADSYVADAQYRVGDDPAGQHAASLGWESISSYVTDTLEGTQRRKIGGTGFLTLFQQLDARVRTAIDANDRKSVANSFSGPVWEALAKNRRVSETHNPAMKPFYERSFRLLGPLFESETDGSDAWERLQRAAPGPHYSNWDDQ